MIGAFSDELKTRFGNEALRYAIASGAAFYVIAALLFSRTAKRLEVDWRREPARA